MYLKKKKTCCVLAYLRNAIVSREPVAHTLWNCRCIQQFILNTKSYQSIKHLCLAVSTTLHFKFICVCTRYSINPFSVIQRTCNTHIVKLQMHPNFMLKSSSSWFDCGVTHQIWHTLSLLKIRGCVAVPKCVWHVFPKPSSYDCKSEMRQRQRIIMLFVQDAPSLLTSWKLDFLFSFFYHKYQSDHSGTSGRSNLWSSLTPLQCCDISNLAFNLRGWVLKHDHPYKVPSVLCY